MENKTLKIACFQFELEKNNNFNLIENKLSDFFKNNQVDLIVLNELAVGGAGALEEKYYIENYINYFQKLANTENTWIIPGTFYEKINDCIFNVAPVINSNGEVVKKAIKMFPWLPYEENVSPGNDVCIFDYPNFGSIGVHICYDLWFPESARMMALNGALLIINPTLTPTIDREVETIMARSTAVQQQLYYVNVNSSGDQGCGMSIAVDPNGEIIHKSENHEDIFIIEISNQLVNESRKNGMYNLGQPLKSFRDHPSFKNSYKIHNEYLQSLGELKKPK
ncbi:uncharacterized protein METZ01_LOCUS201944 [marine metagenome]|uniref:CN hydrolase domain-containing protein n=1 Tax=marine metagenome TaxID=408172 RepID=A0A382EEJ9_9ZZZZ|tara:strand:- start:167 stop:1006 length:840 start_codon:yes stop_codon:yes gene_type:complete